MTSSADQPEERWDNGLPAAAFVPLADVDAEIGPDLLRVLERARIAAYLVPAGSAPVDGVIRQRLYVAASDRTDARTIVASAMRSIRPAGTTGAPAPLTDPLDEIDTEAQFAALIADWHVDTLAAVRSAERDLTREDAEWRARLEPPADALWLDDEHYTPPPPPPLPRLALPTVWALVLLVLSLGVLVFGGRLGLSGDLTFLLGVAGILLSAGMLIMRLRERPEDDDGAVV
jgi:hypothetical protein